MLKKLYLQAVSLAFDFNSNEKTNTDYHANVKARYFTERNVVEMSITSCRTGLEKFTFIFDSSDPKEYMRNKLNGFKKAIEELSK